MTIWAPTTYEAGPGLPELGGDRAVYRLAPGDDADLQRIADVLGLEGQVVRDGDTVRIPSGDQGALETWDGAWFSFWSGRGTSVGVAVACSPEGICEEPPAPQRPADLPTEDEARSLAMALFGAAPLPLDGATVTVDDGITAWYVNVQYQVDGITVDGLTAYASIDGSGVLDASGPLGSLERVGSYPTITATQAIDRLNQGWGPMPLLEGGPVDTMVTEVAPVPPDTEPAATGQDEPVPADEPTSAEAGATQEGEETQGGGSSGSAADDGTAPDGTTSSGGTTPPDDATTPDREPDGIDEPAPEPHVIDEPAPEPYVEPEPVVVTLTGVSWTLTTFWSWDGSGIYLLPAYRYTGPDVDYGPTVPAVTDDMIAPPPGNEGNIDDRDSAGVDGTGRSVDGDPGSVDEPERTNVAPGEPEPDPAGAPGRAPSD